MECEQEELDLDLYLNIDNIQTNQLKKKLFLELKYSLIPEWYIKNPDKSILPHTHCLKSHVYENNFFNDIEFKKFILDGFNSTNQINNYNPDYEFNDDFIHVLEKLNKEFGVRFEMKSNPHYQIQIKPNEVIFPICCVGKNRSQYLFYYLKNLQALCSGCFEVGYPSSGDELSVLNVSNEIPNKTTGFNKSNILSNILSSYSTQYKKDNFSDLVSKSFGITNPDNLNLVPRSIHVFDKILKQKENYPPNDIKNYEEFKYSKPKHDIFNYKQTTKSNDDYAKIKNLFVKYYLNPSNILELLNYENQKEFTHITYVCLSDKSFYNLCMCLYSTKNKYPEIKLELIRIVYFGIQDIFQKKNTTDEVMLEFKNKFVTTFQFVNL